MSTNSKGMFYPAPYALPGSTYGPHLVTADATVGPFDTEGASQLLATLALHEFKTIDPTGANNAIVFIDRTPGVQTTHVAIVYAVAGNNTALSVAVSTRTITVNSATDGSGNPTSTANQVMAAILASAAANALVVMHLAAGNDGTGVIAAVSSTALGGVTGTTPTLDVSLKSAIDETSLATPTGQYLDFSGGTNAFTQKTAVGASEGRVFDSLGLTAEWLIDVGGTTPVFAISINTLVRPQAAGV